MVGFFRERRAKVRHKGTIRGMYVPYEDQGKGVGTALLAAAVKRARLVSGLEQVALAVVNSKHACAKSVRLTRLRDIWSRA